MPVKSARKRGRRSEGDKRGPDEDDGVAGEGGASGDGSIGPVGGSDPRRRVSRWLQKCRALGRGGTVVGLIIKIGEWLARNATIQRF